MIDDSIYKCEFIRKENIWQKAEDFRKRYWPESSLPINMESVINRLGLDIIPEHGIGKQIRAYLKADLSGIVVDCDIYMDEFDRYAGALRFSFAHEVGHLVLHRNSYERFVFSSVEEYKEFIGNFPDEDHLDFEYQANEFAGRLLVPREALAKELRKAYERIAGNESLVSMARDNPDVVLNRITPTLRKPFGVSDDVIRKRIEREGLALPRW